MEPNLSGFAQLPKALFDGMQAPTDMSAESRWHGIASVSAGLLMHLRQGAPYAYPEEGQRIEEFARGQLAEAAAAALAELFDHAIDTTDESHLETFATAFIESARIPEDAAAALHPIIAGILPPLVHVITAARAVEDLAP